MLTAFHLMGEKADTSQGGAFSEDTSGSVEAELQPWAGSSISVKVLSE